MAYQKTINFSNGADLLITGGTIVREIKVPQSVVAKLRVPSPYNEALDSTEIVPEKIIEQPVVQGKDPESEFSKPIDVAGRLSGNNAEKVEEPAIPVAQSIDPQTTVVSEPAYGEMAVPVNNVINFPEVREEPASQESAQNLEELEDAISRMEESISITKALLDQAKLALEKAKGMVQEDYKKVA